MIACHMALDQWTPPGSGAGEPSTLDAKGPISQRPDGGCGPLHGPLANG